MSFNNMCFWKEGCCGCISPGADSSPSTEKPQGNKWQRRLPYIEASGFSTDSRGSSVGGPEAALGPVV